MLGDEMLGQRFLEFFLLYPRARHHKAVTVSEHRHGNCARMIQTRRKLAPVVSHRCHGILTRNIKALCSVLRSIHGFVQHCVTTRTLVVFFWHLDHDRTTCRAVESALYWCRRIPELSLQQVLSACQSYSDWA